MLATDDKRLKLLGTLIVQAVTLPKAIVLWTEPDLRVDDDDTAIAATGMAERA